MALALGLDFGTTNTVMATPGEDGAARLVVTRFEGADLDTLRTALAAWQSDGVRSFEAGPFAIERFIEAPDDTRFIQSMKTFAASPLFQGTYLYAKRFTFEDLMRVFLERVLAHANVAVTPGARVVVGRPVAFAGAAPDPRLATQRYMSVLRDLGFAETIFVLEPVAAAFYFARDLKRAATVLVADFGGGTTDFSVMRFEHKGGRLRARPLAHGGVGVAGDQFDYRIISEVILPRLGKGGKYRSWDKDSDLPSAVFVNFAHWNTMSVMRASPEFRDLKATLKYCLEPEKIERFIRFVEEDQGYPLYAAVSRAKMALSSEAECTLDFRALGEGANFTIRRADFERWISEDLARIEAALTHTLERGKLVEGDIDQVFLTGGSSFVPAVRNIFTRRFGQRKIASGGELVSIANGLAMIAQSEDYREWAAEAP